MAKGGRRAAKGATKDASAAGPSQSADKPRIPAPFAPAPAALAPFLATLDPSHLYITHVDRHPAALKRRVFAVPVLMNVLFAAALAWRAWRILPWYQELFRAAAGLDSALRIDAAQATWARLVAELLRRALVFLLDFALARFVAPWPYDFFLRPGNNPTRWRRRVGFRPAEVAVRRSRLWDRALPADWMAEEVEDSVFAERIMPAVDKQWVAAKTAYLMLDQNWDLDWRAMVAAHTRLDAGANALQDFEKTVLVHHEVHGWLAWQLWKLDQDVDDAGRQKILTLQEKLAALGKEALFFRWVELLQFETAQPGGFTPERQARAMHETRRLFAQHEVDFDTFWAEVGGGEELLGAPRS